MKIIKINKEDLKEDLYNFNLLDLNCKHIAYINSTTQKIFKLSESVGYKWCILGSNRNSDISNEKERIIQMKDSNYRRPIRIIITKDFRMWCDNTHWTISYILKYGKNIKIKDIPFYIINLKEDIIIDFNNLVMIDYEDIHNIISCAKELQTRIDNGWRPCEISYTIGDLMKSLDF
jgi:hypothetical protein